MEKDPGAAHEKLSLIGFSEHETLKKNWLGQDVSRILFPRKRGWLFV